MKFRHYSFVLSQFCFCAVHIELHGNIVKLAPAESDFLVTAWFATFPFVFVILLFEFQE